MGECTLPYTYSVHMGTVKGYIEHKVLHDFNNCDDNFATSLNLNRFAVSDGSSSDFFSKILSRLFVDKFIEHGEQMLSEDSIKGINNEWRGIVQGKLERAGCKPGSFPYVRFQRRDPGCATLIGLEFRADSDGKMHFVCIGLGDSVLFFIREGDVLPTIQFSSDSNSDYSYDPAIQFGYTPVIANSYSTTWLTNIKRLERPLEKGAFLLMTDALAEWVLHCKDYSQEELFHRLLSINSQEEFVNFMDFARAHHAHMDDMTLLTVFIDDNVNLEWDINKCSIYTDYREIAKREEIEEYAIEKCRKRVKLELNQSFEKEKLQLLDTERRKAETERIKAVQNAKEDAERDKDNAVRAAQQEAERDKEKAINAIKEEAEKEKEKAIRETKERAEQEKQEAIKATRESAEKEKQSAIQEAVSEALKSLGATPSPSVTPTSPKMYHNCAEEFDSLIKKVKQLRGSKGSPDDIIGNILRYIKEAKVAVCGQTSTPRSRKKKVKFTSVIKKYWREITIFVLVVVLTIVCISNKNTSHGQTRTQTSESTSV